MLCGNRYLSLIRHCLVVWGICVLSGIAAAEPRASPPSFRKVIVRVINERDEPMSGVTVQLLGTGRDALQAMDIDSRYNEPEVWRFISDAHGRCTVRFGCFKGFDSEKLVGKDVPGWGRFYFIAETGRRRGVSRGIVHQPRGEHDHYDDEWSRRGTVKTGDHLVMVTLRMRPGLSVRGRVLDIAGKPVRSFSVGSEQNLGSESHTGYGNEIFRQSTFTDEDGRFVLNDIFPNTFYLGASMKETALPVWMRTSLRGKWSAVPLDKITPRQGEKEIRMMLVVSPELPYRYSGRILDEEGSPVSGAAITLGISRHRQSRSYEDSHTFLHADSDNDGRFEIRTATPFVLWISVNASGFEDSMEDYEAKDIVKAPGQWNITLRRLKE